MSVGIFIAANVYLEEIKNPHHIKLSINEAINIGLDVGEEILSTDIDKDLPDTILWIDTELIMDKLGHMVGDCALKDTADALKQACKDVSGRLFLCRFGGDEFVFIMHDSSQYEVEQLRTCIKQELEKINVTCGRSYIIDTSIGLAEGRCANLEDVEHLIRVADEAMYHDKKQTKRSPNSMG